MAFRVAYAFLLVYWRVFRPVARGAHVAVWCENELLLIRNSYRSDRSVPGGGIHRDEDPKDGAIRELAEETGIVVAPDQMIAFREIEVTHDHFRDRCHFFEVRLVVRPTIQIDHREVVDAGWYDPRALDRTQVHAPTRAYLELRGLFDVSDGAQSPPDGEQGRTSS